MHFVTDGKIISIVTQHGIFLTNQQSTLIFVTSPYIQVLVVDKLNYDMWNLLLSGIPDVISFEINGIKQTEHV